MERYNLATITKLIYDSGLSFFEGKTIRDVLEIKKESTLFSLIQKLIKAQVLIKIERDKYLLKGARVSDFALANFLYQPSYVSFESALNFYGILSQFPYEISSATTRKPTKKFFQNKVFTYTQIKKDLFWGYEKKEDFVIALPEKALFDQLYLAAKGYRGVNLDEYNLERINVPRLKKYLAKYPKTRQFKSSLETLKKYIRL
ncbi:hypothetical protein J7K44_00530 [bacterium]|nr:hypothetical protein [bacterium]